MMTARVGVGVGKDDLPRESVERRKERVGFLGGFAEEGHGVIGNEDARAVKIEAEPLLHLNAREQRAATQMIERGSAGAMDSPRLFAHRNDAVASVVGRGEVDVTHLGERVSYGVVDGAFADFASLDVRDGN